MKRLLNILSVLIILASLGVPFVPNPIKADTSITQTFYPSLDGSIMYTAAAGGDNWGNTWNATGGGTFTADNISTSVYAMQLSSHPMVDKWFQLNRGQWYFDTSNLTASANISSAVLQFYVKAKLDQFAPGTMDVVSSNSTSVTTLVDGDYNNYETTLFSSQTIASLSVGAYNSWTLNADGIASVNKTGISRFATISEWDRTNTPPAWIITQQAYAEVYTSKASSNLIPRLIITYTVAGFGLVETSGASTIGATTATLSGTLTSMGLYPYSSVSFEYGTTTSYGQTTAEQQLTVIGGFTQSISGLSYSQLYHFRAIARFGSSYVYGADNVFTTVAAPGATTDLRIISAHMFSDYMTAGDRLLCVETINKYTGYYPNQRAGMWFTIQLLDTDNTTVIGASPLSNWGDRPSSIYFNPTDAASLVDGSAYTVLMVGNLSLSGVSTNYTLQTLDWAGYATTPLDSWARSTAINMEISDGRSDYLVELTDRGTVISDAAGGFFTVGVPAISQQRPYLFTTSQLSASLTPGTSSSIWDKLPAAVDGWRSYVGEGIYGDFNVFASPFGITGKDFGVGIVLLLLVLVMIIVVTGTGGMGALGALLIALPILWLSTYWRVMPVFVISILAIIMAWFAIRQFWIKTL